MRFSVTFALIAYSLFVPGCTGAPLVESASFTSSSLSCALPGCTPDDPMIGTGDATTVSQSDSAGRLWFALGAWHVPVSVPSGQTLTSYTVDVFDNGSGNGHTADASPVVVQLRSSRDNGATWTVLSSGQSCACGTEQTWTTSTNYRPAAGERLELRFSSAIAGQPTPNWSAVAQVSQTTAQVYTAMFHVVSSAAMVIGGQTPISFSTQVIVGTNTTVQYPLNGIDSSWPISSVRLYMAQTPTCFPTYDLVQDSVGSSGVSGFTAIAGTSLSTPALVVDLPIPSGVYATSPLAVRIKTDACSTTSLGAIAVGHL